MEKGQRQQVLALWLADSNLDAHTVAWSVWDGSGARQSMAGDADQPPYPTGLAALRDGWRLFQASPLLPHPPGGEFTTSYLKYEFLFEKLVEPGAEAEAEDA